MWCQDALQNSKRTQIDFSEACTDPAKALAHMMTFDHLTISSALNPFSLTGKPRENDNKP